jgi:hypothetical protein
MSRSLLRTGDFHAFNLDQEIALGAVALYGLEEAVEYLYAERDIEVTEKELDSCRRRFPEKYQAIQEKLAPMIEAMSITGMRSSVRTLNAPIALAVGTAHEALKDGRVNGVDAAKMGRELTEIQAKQNNTQMVLQERPSQIVEKRSTEEILRQLEAKGVVKRPELEMAEAEVVSEHDGRS